MEFFKIINVQTTENQLQNSLIFENFKELTDSLPILNFENDTANCTGIWGDFTLKREPIKGGLRFALIECPNALAWTITSGFSPAKDQIVLHLTINRTEKAQPFIDEINDFLSEWELGLIRFFKN